MPLKTSNADVAKLVDALDLGSSVARREGSSPFIRTIGPFSDMREGFLYAVGKYFYRILNTCNSFQLQIVTYLWVIMKMIQINI